MARFRGEKLLAALSADELRLLERRIASGRRGSLKTLFSLVRTAIDEERELAKEDVFRQVFGRPYCEEEDYLLRNEFRLLVNRAQEVLAGQVHVRELRERRAVYDLALLRGLFEKSLWTEFRSMYRKMVERARRNCDYYTVHRMHDLYFSFLMQQEGRFELYAEARALLEEQLVYLKQWYCTDVAHNQSRRVVCDHMMQITNTTVDPVSTQVGTDADFTGIDNPLLRLFEAKARAFRATGEERIRHAHAAVDSVMQLDRGQYGNEWVMALGNLGLAYYLDQRFDEARTWYEQAFRHRTETGGAVDAGLLFNYAGSLMKLKEYRAVLHLIERHRELIDASPRVLFRFECFRSFSHIFLNEPELAFASIPATIKQRPEPEYHYFRFALLIIPYLRGDGEDALRETVNFSKYFHRGRGKVGLPHELTLVTLYRRFFAAVLTPPGDKRLTMLRRLQAMQREFCTAHPAYVDYLPYVWLHEQVERLV